MTAVGRVLLSLHLLAVLLGLAYLVLSLAVGAPDANIGAGLAGLWLAALGLPWSLVLLADVALGLALAVAVATALLNLALHLLLQRRRARRRAS